MKLLVVYAHGGAALPPLPADLTHACQMVTIEVGRCGLPLSNPR